MSPNRGGKGYGFQGGWGGKGMGKGGMYGGMKGGMMGGKGMMNPMMNGKVCLSHPCPYTVVSQLTPTWCRECRTRCCPCRR